MAQLRLSNSDLTATIDDKHVAACAGRSWFLKKSSHCSYVASTVRVGLLTKSDKRILRKDKDFTCVESKNMLYSDYSSG